MATALSLSIISAAAIMFFSRRLLCYMRHFQEGGYSRRQLKNWVITNGVYDKKGSLIATIAALMLELTEEVKVVGIGLVICAIAAISLICLGLWENDPRKFGTFKLQTTSQATATYNLALALYSIALVIVVVSVYKLGARDDIACYWLVVIVAIQSSPIWLVLASTLKGY
jgi:hypothetical protein